MTAINAKVHETFRAPFLWSVPGLRQPWQLLLPYGAKKNYHILHVTDDHKYSIMCLVTFL